MTALIVGATGATGRLLVETLLNQGIKVRIIIRSPAQFPDSLITNSQLSITIANLLDMTDEELQRQVQGCEAVISCLGHNLTIKGLFGHPRRLVSIATNRLCEAIKKTDPERCVKYILMNTTGNQNKQAGETISISQAIVVGLLRHLLPPHADNEEAAAYLQSHFGKNQNVIEWTAVRPDTLTNEVSVTEYDVYSSPTRSAIFDAGKSSRINVANFMSRLVTNDDIWQKWKRHMPVIYNAEK